MEHLSYTQLACDVQSNEVAICGRFEDSKKSVAVANTREFFCTRRYPNVNGKSAQSVPVFPTFVFGIELCAPSRNCKKHWDKCGVWRATTAIRMLFCFPILALAFGDAGFGDAVFGDRAPDCASFLQVNAYHFLLEFFVINLCHFFSVLFSPCCYNFTLPQQGLLT